MNARSSPSLERRERERADTRRKILEAARRMFVQQGYAGTTMRAIAAKIGYTPTAIYHHFKDKDALVAELAGLDFRALAHALQQTGTVGDPLDRLEKIGAAYVEFGLTHPMQYQFLFMTRRPNAGAPGGMARDPGEDAYGFLRQTCAAVIATGRLRPEFTDPDELAQMCWCPPAPRPPRGPSAPARSATSQSRRWRPSTGARVNGSRREEHTWEQP